MTASTERKIGLRLNDVSLCIYKVHGASDAMRAIGVHLNFHILAHLPSVWLLLVLDTFYE